MKCTMKIDISEQPQKRKYLTNFACNYDIRRLHDATERMKIDIHLLPAMGSIVKLLTTINISPQRS